MRMMVSKMNCPNCNIEFDLYEELYDDLRDQTHKYYGCSECGKVLHFVE